MKEYLVQGTQLLELSINFFIDKFHPLDLQDEFEIISTKYVPSDAERIAVTEAKYQQTCDWPLGIKEYAIKLLVKGKEIIYPVIVKSKQPYSIYAAQITKILRKCGIDFTPKWMPY